MIGEGGAVLCLLAAAENVTPFGARNAAVAVVLVVVAVAID